MAKYRSSMTSVGSEISKGSKDADGASAYSGGLVHSGEYSEGNCKDLYAPILAKGVQSYQSWRLGSKVLSLRDCNERCFDCTWTKKKKCGVHKCGFLERHLTECEIEAKGRLAQLSFIFCMLIKGYVI